MTTLDLYMIPGLDDTKSLRKMREESYDRMLKAYRQESIAAALARAKASLLEKR